MGEGKRGVNQLDDALQRVLVSCAQGRRSTAGGEDPLSPDVSPTLTHEDGVVRSPEKGVCTGLYGLDMYQPLSHYGPAY